MNAWERISVVQGNIVKLPVDVIVNAANNTLLGGGGVDGAIHRAAGLKLVAECALLGGCKTGQAKITKGYNLPAKHVIHTVGPVWHGGNRDEAELLASCYRTSLQLCVEHGLKTIAFPAISCGVYGYPIEEAVPIAVRTTLEFLVEHELPEWVQFCCFDKDLFEEYQKVVATLKE
jgi:O-acetyl-ADP-ribose deacetylase